MPIIKSAKKRVRTAQKATVRNLRTKRTVRSAIKSVHSALKGGKKSVGKEYNEAISALDTAVKKGILHKNKAARLKSRLAETVKKSGAKVTGSSTSAKKSSQSPAKSKATKKPPAKKKSGAKPKKPVTKKKTAKK